MIERVCRSVWSRVLVASGASLAGQERWEKEHGMCRAREGVVITQTCTDYVQTVEVP